MHQSANFLGLGLWRRTHSGTRSPRHCSWAGGWQVLPPPLHLRQLSSLPRKLAVAAAANGPPRDSTCTETKDAVAVQMIPGLQL